MSKRTVVLAYSGGLDTSVAIRWLAEQYGCQVVALTVDLGNLDRDLADVRQRALQIGAVDSIVIDAKTLFAEDYVLPAFQAGALYEGCYPLATALGRPLIAKQLAETALEIDAEFVAHGCTGKGNDQVRFDVAIGALAPELKVLAPIREWGMSREEEIEYAEQHSIPITVNSADSYSVDQNLWGRSIEAGPLEDPWIEPNPDVYEWTAQIDDTPAEPGYVTIGFEQGRPVCVDGEAMPLVDLVYKVQEEAGRHGVGRIDHVENRVVGIKSREIYEAPAAVALHAAHQALEDLTLTKDAARFKAKAAIEYADLIYNGHWFSPHREDLAAYVTSTQRWVTGEVRLKLHKGSCQVVGRRSEASLYSKSLATYDRVHTFDYKSAEGFIDLWGLPLRVWASIQAKRALTNPEDGR